MNNANIRLRGRIVEVLDGLVWHQTVATGASWTRPQVVAAALHALRRELVQKKAKKKMAGG